MISCGLEGSVALVALRGVVRLDVDPGDCPDCGSLLRRGRLIGRGRVSSDLEDRLTVCGVFAGESMATREAARLAALPGCRFFDVEGESFKTATLPALLFDGVCGWLGPSSLSLLLLLPLSLLSVESLSLSSSVVLVCNLFLPPPSTPLEPLTLLVFRNDFFDGLAVRFGFFFISTTTRLLRWGVPLPADRSAIVTMPSFSSHAGGRLFREGREVDGDEVGDSALRLRR